MHIPWGLNQPLLSSGLYIAHQGCLAFGQNGWGFILHLAQSLDQGCPRKSGFGQEGSPQVRVWVADRVNWPYHLQPGGESFLGHMSLWPWAMLLTKQGRMVHSYNNSPIHFTTVRPLTAIQAYSIFFGATIRFTHFRSFWKNVKWMRGNYLWSLCEA